MADLELLAEPSEATTEEVRSYPSFSVHDENSVFITMNLESTLDDYFYNQKALLEDAAKYDSHILSLITHPAFTNIVKLGKRIVPTLLEDMRNTNFHWFYALSLITGVNPVTQEHQGVIPEMVNDWCNWASENDLI